MPGTSHILEAASPIRRIITEFRRRRDALIDRRWNVDTLSVPAARLERGDRHHDSVHYEPIWYPVLLHLLKPMKPGPDDVVFDVGCGLGRVLLACSRLGVKECIGVEIAPALAERARHNARQLRGGRSPIQIRQEDASTADYSGGTIYILHNPFGAATLAAVLERLRHSLDDDPRRIQIAYFVPRHEQVLQECEWLRFAGRKRSPLHRFPISYWVHDG